MTMGKAHPPVLGLVPRWDTPGVAGGRKGGRGPGEANPLVFGSVSRLEPGPPAMNPHFYVVLVTSTHEYGEAKMDSHDNNTLEISPLLYQ